MSDDSWSMDEDELELGSCSPPPRRELPVLMKPGAEEAPKTPPVPPASVTVRNLPGEILAVFEPGPTDVQALKEALSERISVPPGLQRLVRPGEAAPLQEGAALPPKERVEVTLVIDETPMYTWDIEKNSCRVMLEREANTVSSPRLRTDYINVLTQEPLRNGTHYVQFIMHSIGDEQWCGLADASRAGCYVSGRALKGWMYYCGRMHTARPTVLDGCGALHAGGRAAAAFKTLRPSGDVIGLLVDLDAGALVFDLNGEVQGACPVGPGPLWLLTHLDEPGDRVELRRLLPSEAPEVCRQALRGPLLDLSQGPRLSCTLFDGSDESSQSQDEDSMSFQFGGSTSESEASNDAML